jgi:hypothetical protein
MSDDDRFCPLCGVTLELHNDQEDCATAEMKARVLNAWDRMIWEVTH